ncbi:SDR family NAD(P)-dependent oxidoreductase [Stappia indica]|uniref:SDR family NAD(P)-dependent oxidoreductase n=1 Tax=Stappia indica TaxID=538381 RepID=UPI001CD20FF1|nr:SDR family oxidoreductase [Stappia indica]MCA1296881.1 SDR family oxidoreductase [Stappia indica]
MRSVFISGVAGGFGGAIAAALAADGMAIFGSDTHASEEICRTDVTDEAQVKAAFDQAEALNGPVSVLVTCAGIMPSGTESVRIPDMTVEEWDSVFAVNTRGTFLCLREFLRRREQAPLHGATAVLMSSAAAQLGGYRGSASYVASKAALLGLTKIAAREGAAYGVTVNCVAAGPVRTPMLEAATTPESVAALSARIPLGKIGTTDDIAAAVLYLVSPGARWVTGTTMDVNGGYRMQ